MRAAMVAVRAPRVDDVVRAFFGAPPVEPDRSRAPPGLSAVLLAVYDTEEDGPALLYTRRSETLRSHAGEISFPGGRVDATDAHPLAAALREAEEEVGLAPDEVDVLGHLTDYLTYRNVLVCAYVGAVLGEVEEAVMADEPPRRRPRAPPTTPRSPDEVAEVLAVPVRDLLDPATYEGRRIQGTARDRVVHYWHLERCTVWGITGELTARFLQRVWGWSPPAPARTISSPSEFLPEAFPSSGT